MNKILSASLCAVLLSACANAKIEKADPNPTPHDSAQGPGVFSGKSGNILDAFKKGSGGVFDSSNGEETTEGGLGINKYLWQAALQTVSFMPIKQADSAGGVILTDWYANPDQPNERVKVDVLILTKTLSSQGVKVSVFKQTKTSQGWESAPVGDVTATKLEETILTKARTLHVQEKARQ